VTDGLVQWLGEQVDQDAAPIPMPAWHEPFCLDPYIWGGTCGYCGADEDPGNVTYQERSPRALWEVNAKRQIVARYEFACEQATRLKQSEEERESWVKVAGALQSCALSLAMIYVDRPGYREEWAP
jgi:hypothetical protein